MCGENKWNHTPLVVVKKYPLSPVLKDEKGLGSGKNHGKQREARSQCLAQWDEVEWRYHRFLGQNVWLFMNIHLTPCSSKVFHGRMALCSWVTSWCVFYLYSYPGGLYERFIDSWILTLLSIIMVVFVSADPPFRRRVLDIQGNAKEIKNCLLTSLRYFLQNKTRRSF